MAVEITGSISAANTFTNPVDDVLANDAFDISISGTFTATVTVQRKFEGTSTWLDVDSFTSTVEKIGYNASQGTHYRIGIKAGDYTNGTAIVAIRQ